LEKRNPTELLREWYAFVENGDEVALAQSVMNDPDNSIVYTRLANCAAKTVEMMLMLAEFDKDRSTRDRVVEAMRNVLEADRE